MRFFGGAPFYISSLAYSPDGKRLVSGGWNEAFYLWDATTGKEVRSFAGHAAGDISVAYRPDNKHLASASNGCLPLSRCSASLSSSRIWLFLLERELGQHCRRGREGRHRRENAQAMAEFVAEAYQSFAR